MNFVRVASSAGITIGLWDLVTSFHEEREFIWRHSLRKLNVVKILFIATRYSPFLIHIANFVIVHHMEKHLPVIPTYVCLRWLAYSVIICEWVLSLLLINLMLRVYALYNRSPFVIVTLIGLLVAKLLNVWLCWHFFFPHHIFSATCMPVNERPIALITFSFIEVLIQGVPVYITFSRTAEVAYAFRETDRITLLTYLRRGGALSWSAVTCFSFAVSGFALYKKNTPSDSQQLFFPIFVTITSSLGCHLILQLRTPNRSHSNSASGSPTRVLVELDTYDSAWEIQTYETPEAAESASNEAKSPDTIHV